MIFPRKKSLSLQIKYMRSLKQNLFHHSTIKPYQAKIRTKKEIDEQIQEANDILESKNVAIESINEHIKLNEEPEKNGLSTCH